MTGLKQIFVIVVFAVSALTLGAIATSAEDSQKKQEGIPQIVHFDATSTYLARSSDLVDMPKFRVRAHGSIFVPVNTRVSTKVLLPFRSAWYPTESFGPYPKGQTVNFVRSWDVDAKSWNGKTFPVRLMATSSAGADMKEAAVALRRP